MKGRIIGISGPTVIADLPQLSLYERVVVGESGLLGEVVRLHRDRAIIQVYEDTRGLAAGEPVEGLGTPLTVELGPGLLGRIFDGLQSPLKKMGGQQDPFLSPGMHASLFEKQSRWNFSPCCKPGQRIGQGDLLGTIADGAREHPILMPEQDALLESIAEGDIDLKEPVAMLDGGRPVFATCRWPVRIPRPCREKLPAVRPLITGQRCIDFLFPLAEGGTAIFPGGFGTGKTILEQTIAKFAAVDIVVYVGCGERGNEMAAMLEEFKALRDPWTDRPLTERTLTVVNTSNMPVVAREASIYTAVTMGEYFRDLGYRVLLLADSLSRWAEALREISSALEEMPGEEGYPTYLASRLSTFMARAGRVKTLSGKEGSLTMILSVSPPGGDFTEPVTQACLRNTGSFLMLDADLAHRRHYPAVNWTQSYSLYQTVDEYFRQEVSHDWSNLKAECRALLQRESELAEVAEVVGLEGMQEKDRLLMQAAEKIRTTFLAQNAFSRDAFSPPEKTAELIASLLGEYRRQLAGLEGDRQQPETSGE